MRPQRALYGGRAAGSSGWWAASASAVLPPLDRDQLAEIHRHVLDAAVQRGAAVERAQELADAVVAALVLAEPDPSPPDAPEEDDPTVGSLP